jgi:aldehyde:ferredoxin oxidoreductase
LSYLYGGKILHVDLTHRQVEVVPTERYSNLYVGGRGIDARLLYECVGPSTDPLGPENVVCFGAGPLSGTLFPGSSRTDVMCKSPVTGFVGNANMGGNWAAQLKQAGWDHVVLHGRAADPVFIYIRNEKVEIRDARHLWGANTYDTQSMIESELANPEVSTVCIGPAGENLVTYANVHTNVGNSGSRTGCGAVLGSKNVKAIAVRGTQGVKVADSGAFLDACLASHAIVRESAAYERTHTIGATDANRAYVLSGAKCGTDVYRTASLDDADSDYDFQHIWKEFGYRRTGCTGCPVHCMEAYNVPGIGATVASCDLYTAFSAGLRNADVRLWYRMVRECHRQGIDSSSTGAIIAWLMHLWELGIIDESLTDGYRMEWGDRTAIESTFANIVSRQGLGDVLARGMKEAADYLDSRIPSERRNGTSTYDYALQVNNNPMFLLGPRFHGMALAYAVGRRSDLISDLDLDELDMIATPVFPHYTHELKEKVIASVREEAELHAGTAEAGDVEGYRGKATLVHLTGMTTGICDLCGTCKWHTKFGGMDIGAKDLAQALTAGLGRTVRAEDLITASLRTRNLERALECRMGRRRENDTIPKTEFDKTIARGYWKGKGGVSREKLEKMKTDYYIIRGWDVETGVPLKATLAEYGLDKVAADLAAAGILPESTPATPVAGERKLASILADEDEWRHVGGGGQESADERD